MRVVMTLFCNSFQRIESDTILDRWENYTYFAVPAPLQAGVIDPWVIYTPSGRWTIKKPLRICPLEHPVFDPRTGDML